MHPAQTWWNLGVDGAVILIYFVSIVGIACGTLAGAGFRSATTATRAATTFANWSNCGLLARLVDNSAF